MIISTVTFVQVKTAVQIRIDRDEGAIWGRR